MRNNPVLSVAKKYSTLTTLYYPQSNGQNFDASKPAKNLPSPSLYAKFTEITTVSHNYSCFSVLESHFYMKLCDLVC